MRVQHQPIKRCTKHRSSNIVALGIAGGLAVCGYAWHARTIYAEALPSASVNTVKQTAKVTKQIVRPGDNAGLKLTLYQYRSCPFCCKVRAYLDYKGFSYDVVEVNSVFRKEIKWSKYKKVPILVCEEEGSKELVSLIDSSMIVSTLETSLHHSGHLPMETIIDYYPVNESKKGRRTVYDYPNKYFIMYGDEHDKARMDENKEQRRWREWVDDNLVHMISPNVYRSPQEAIETFRYFSDVGDWEKVFSSFERIIVIYVGAAAMFLIGKKLKKKYALKDNVRESLYDACQEWMKAVGKNRKFLGGDTPSLADLAVYGALSSFEGCKAFSDLQENTNIGEWYWNTKTAVDMCQGSPNK